MSSSLGAWHGGAGGGRGKDSWFGSPFFSSDEADVPASQYEDGTSALARARVDWHETDDAHVFSADIPGLKKEEVKVHVDDGSILQISGERRKEREGCHHVERQLASFVRRFRLPENADVDHIQCGVENGLLRVTVRKKNVT